MIIRLRASTTVRCSLLLSLGTSFCSVALSVGVMMHKRHPWTAPSLDAQCHVAVSRRATSTSAAHMGAVADFAAGDLDPFHARHDVASGSGAVG